MRTVMFTPHSDDEALFAAYTVLRYMPWVVICFPSVRDYGSTEERFQESLRANEILGAAGVEQWDGQRLEARMRELDTQQQPELVFVPHPSASHPDHAAVADAAAAVFGDRVRYHHTYDHGGKVRAGQRVAVEDGWPDLKRRALACYRTQITHPRARVFFDESRFELDEYEPVPPPTPQGHDTDPAGAIEPIRTPEDGLAIQTPAPTHVETQDPPPAQTRRRSRRSRAPQADR